MKQLLKVPKAPLMILVLLALSISCQKEDRSVTPLSSGSELKLIENSKDVPVEDVFFNECCGEEVHVTGTAHFLMTDNIIHIVVKDISGDGLSTGYNYTGIGSSVNNIPFYNNQYDGQLTFNLNMSNENGCSFMLHVTLHITLNANNEVTAELERIETTCH
ncbi:MAG TPA: hypothetical protein VE978_02055 [Chitinophagales bacterium]|nr:hypothetical protein [Chitinophagales bacterium]